MNKKNIKKNYIYNVIYQLLIIIIPLIVTPYTSRVLLPEGIGKYSFTTSIITYFTLFASLGFGYYAQREIAKNSQNKSIQSTVFWEILICRLLSVLISVIVNIILVFTGVYGNNTTLMMLLTINIAAIAVDISFFFQGNEEFGRLVFINIIIKILGTISIFLFVKKQTDLWIYALINCLILVISNLSLWPLLFKRLTSVKIKQLRPFKHLKPTLILFIPSIAVTLYTVLDKSLLGIITNSEVQNGYYEQAEKIIKMAMTIITCLGTVMVSRNSYELSHNNHSKVVENNYKSIHFVWLLGFPMAVGIILVSDNLVTWFLGQDFNYCAVLLKVLSPLILIIGLSNVLGMQYLIPYKKDRGFTIAVSIGALSNLILNIPLIYFCGSLGAAIATILAELIVTSVMIILVKKNMTIKSILKSSIKPFIASCIMFGITFPLSYYLNSSILNTLLIIICGVVVYGIAILLLKDKLVYTILLQLKRKIFKKKEQLSPKDFNDTNKDKNIQSPMEDI